MKNIFDYYKLKDITYFCGTTYTKKVILVNDFGSGNTAKDKNLVNLDENLYNSLKNAVESIIKNVKIFGKVDLEEVMISVA